MVIGGEIYLGDATRQASWAIGRELGLQIAAHIAGSFGMLLERSNVETVLVAGRICKWKGRLLDVGPRRLRRDLENSHDFCSRPPDSRRTCCDRTDLSRRPARGG
jgi:hypothetical protein